jgi:glycosyltransferase involved in cell wall biosynthesis
LKTCISVIIPCFNEATNIKECIERIPDLGVDYEIVVVNDGSTDNTFEAARGVKRNNLKVIGYGENRGKGYALRFGLKHSKGEIVVIQDADMATPPEELPEIVRPIIEGKADFVNGTRMVYPMEEGAMKRLHVPGNKLFALLVSLIIGQRLTDTLCGFKAFRKDMLNGKLKEDSWPDFELLIQARRNGLRITEVPIHYKARKAGVSKMKTFRHGYEMFKMLLKSLI